VGVTETVPGSAVSECGTGKTAGRGASVEARAGPASRIVTHAALATTLLTIGG
jgi:hypothetical protein